MKEIIEFLSELNRHNDREWFEANRPRYAEVKQRFEQFVEQLIAGMQQVDPSLLGIGVRDCTYRIYRDVRFSPDKSPYKTHMGAYLCPHGKKSGYAGYYFHIEPLGARYLGHHLLSCGLYMPDTAVIRSVRDEIVTNGDTLRQTIDTAGGYYLETEGSLKRLPAGYPPNTPHAELLKLKNYLITHPLDERFICFVNLVERTVERFSVATPFVKRLNRAVEYVREGNL